MFSNQIADVNRGYGFLTDEVLRHFVSFAPRQSLPNEEASRDPFETCRKSSLEQLNHSQERNPKQGRRNDSSSPEL